MRTIATRSRQSLAAAALSLSLGAAPALAIDVDPGDYQSAPPGTNVLLLYNQVAVRDSAHLEGAGELEEDTGLTSWVGILRYVYFTEIFGITINPQILVPFGTLQGGELAGVRLNDTTGFGDPILASIFWLVERPEQKTWFGITPYVFVPVGSYDDGDALNLGEDRWRYTLQAGLVQGFGDRFLLDLVADVTWYQEADRRQVNGTTLTLSQEETWQFQAWLRYQTKPTAHVAFLYSWITGGEQELGGVVNGFATEVHKVGLQYAEFLTPTLQLLGTVGTDLDVEGGFQEDFRLNLRLTKIF